MKKRKYYKIILIIFALTCISSSNSPIKLKVNIPTKVDLYDSLNLGSIGLSKNAFTYAMTGFNNLTKRGMIHNNILSIIDFSLPSDRKRLFVLNVDLGKVIFSTYTSHGKNSGKIIPTEFSNRENSNKSSLGFYITGSTYTGKHGESLRLLGQEEGINDKALERGIVMHSASYVGENIVKSQGFIGRSQGCPAIPTNISKSIITKIKNGSCLFIYSTDKYYTSHSKMIQSV